MFSLYSNATSSMFPEVLESMTACNTAEWGNPTDSYGFGEKWQALFTQAMKSNQP